MFVSLNAMRVGLLTRFMGVLGIITGVLQILPFGGPLPVVQCFWMLMLSILFLGRWPSGNPPAWQTGRAEPWPSSAELRERRKQAAAEAKRRGLRAAASRRAARARARRGGRLVRRAEAQAQAQVAAVTFTPAQGGYDATDTLS